MVQILNYFSFIFESIIFMYINNNQDKQFCALAATLEHNQAAIVPFMLLV